jgi:endonuclease G
MNMNAKKYIFALLAMVSMGAAQAQVAVTTSITLKDGSVVSYKSTEYDSIRVLRGLDLTDEGSFGVKVYLRGQKSKDYIATNITERQSGISTVNLNRNANPEAQLLEYPRLNADTVNNLLIVHSTQGYGITYSLEWDCQKKANRWTCYEMHPGNSMQNVNRNDDFREDPLIPAEYRTTLEDYRGTGYSRGHLCPSADRLCSSEQNSQTFYLSNMHPQFQAHNGGLWNNLETLVRDTWNTSQYRDTLYVVKAATIDDANIRGYTTPSVAGAKPMLVPKYFYMAILAKKGNTYKAIGIWTLHDNTADTNKHYADYAITIDELEARTGIDFFCNLPDELENSVEATLDLKYWGLQ